jgi:hypothetical protein
LVELGIAKLRLIGVHLPSEYSEPTLYWYPGLEHDTEQPYGVGAGQGVLGLDANGQHAWTTLLLSMVTMAARAVSWLALVSPSVPTQYLQTNTLLAAVADSGTTVPSGTVNV